MGTVAACGDDEEEPSGRREPPRPSRRRRSRSAWSPTSAASTTASFNAVGVQGLKRAESELGAEIRAITSKSNADYVPNLTTLARQQYDLVIAVGFLMAEATEKVANAFPRHELRDHRLPAGAMKSKPKNVAGLLFKEAEAGYLVGYMAGLYVKDKGGDQVISAVGGQKVPAVDAYIAGYQEGAKDANPDIKTLYGYSRGLRRPGEVQGARAQPDRRGLAGRLRRSPAAAASARSTRPRRRACRASASTPTRPTWATTS